MKRKWIFLFVILFVFTNINYVLGVTDEEYNVQVGVFKDFNNAEKTYTELLKNGFKAYKLDSGNNTKVFIGPFTQKSDAVTAMERAKNININGFIVTDKKNGLNTEIEQINNQNYNSKIVKNYSFDRDIKVEGVIQSYNFFFSTNPNWEIEDGCFFELVLSRTDIETYQNSTISVLVNDYPIYSTFIYNKERSKHVLKINIPKDKINEGFNEITIKSYHRITDLPCEDNINPGNWLIYNKESFVHIQYTKKKDSAMLIDFPYPYIEVGHTIPVNTAIIIANEVKTQELTPVMMMAANIGKWAGFNDFGVDILRIKDLQDNRNRHGIYIGNIKTLPKEWISYFTNQDLIMAKQDAVIKEVVAPYNKEKKLLLIVSENIDSLSKAVQALGDKELILQMTNDTQYITKNMKFEQRPSVDKNYIKFDDLGYASIFLEGILYQKATVDVSLPENWKIGEDAQLRINMRYSELLNFERSGLTVYLNGVPIGSKKLSSKYAKQDVFEITIPKDVLKDNYYQLEMDFYLELYDIDCESRRDGNSWAYVLNDSYFYFPHKNKNDNMLENYRNPFMINNSFDNVLFVLPDSPKDSDIKMLANMISYMGQNAERYDGIEVISANMMNETHESRKKVLYGTKKNNSAIRHINDNLHIKFNEVGDRFISNDKMVFLEEYNGHLASIQLLSGKLQQDVLVITATHQDVLQWAAKYLTQSNFIGRLKGDAAVIDTLGNIQYDYYSVKEPKAANELEKVEAYNENASFLKTLKPVQNFIAFMFILLVLVGIIIFIVVRRRGGR